MAENSPKVSIVLPTYNGARYLRQSIDSCLGQTYRNLELIVVDDASTDTTPEIIRSYQDPRIRVIRHEKSKMLPESLNTGFRAVSGDYLTWTSDDNYYVPEAILGKEWEHLVDINICIIKQMASWFGIQTPIVRLSDDG